MGESSVGENGDKEGWEGEHPCVYGTISWIIIKKKKKRKEREQKYGSSICWVLIWQQQPEQDQAIIRSYKFHPMCHADDRGPRAYAIYCHLPGSLTGYWIGNRAAKTGTHTSIKDAGITNNNGLNCCSTVQASLDLSFKSTFLLLSPQCNTCRDHCKIAWD